MRMIVARKVYISFWIHPLQCFQESATVMSDTWWEQVVHFLLVGGSAVENMQMAHASLLMQSLCLFPHANMQKQQQQQSRSNTLLNFKACGAAGQTTCRAAPQHVLGSYPTTPHATKITEVCSTMCCICAKGLPATCLAAFPAGDPAWKHRDKELAIQIS